MTKQINNNWRLAKDEELDLIYGTSARGEIEDVDRFLLEGALGKPNAKNNGGGKLTYCYIFINDDKQIATLYDYKGDDGHVGAKNDEIAIAFMDWFYDAYLDIYDY